MSNDFTGAADLQLLRYAQVWEDHLLLEEALAVTAEDDVLSICSAGDNALALLLRGPRTVTAVDVSPAQAALLQLKAAAIAELTHEDLLILLGLEPGDGPGDALACYRALRCRVPEPARAYFDQRPELFHEGLVHCGRLERYLRGFQREHLAALHPPQVIDQLLDFSDVEAQGRYFRERVATAPFCAAFRAYFGRESLAARGRDEAQFRHVAPMDVGEVLLRRLGDLTERVLLRESPYLGYFFTGRPAAPALRPPYLRQEHHPRLRALLPRLRVVVEDLGALLRREPAFAFSKGNLSDIFEYMGEEDAGALLALLGQRLRPRGRLAYWNLLVERSSLQRRPPRLRHLGDEARALARRDRLFFYQSFHVEEIEAP